MQAFVPYGAYWSTPFARWRGSFAHLHSVEFAAHTTRRFLDDRGIDGTDVDSGVLGMTVPQQGSFYGLPWLMGMAAAGHVAGPTISQACATGARVLAVASGEVHTGAAECVLTVTADRVSNGPQIRYPDPADPGGGSAEEDWVMDNFGCDPFAQCDMTATAENCARKWQVSTEEQHEVALCRYEQYLAALESTNGESFQQKYMPLPFDVPDTTCRNPVGVLSGDEGVVSTSAEKMARLKPVREGGTVTFAGQTHPADGNAGMIVATENRAREMGSDPNIRIRIVAFGQARGDVAYMPSAPIPASRIALDTAGITVKDLAAIKSHNPFAVNDIIFSREMGVDVESMNNFGCSLIWGHPQGPTGMRAIIELIEEVVLKGGGYGLFQGCAAGDSAMAVVLRIY